jgi:uncharacterized membrane protein
MALSHAENPHRIESRGRPGSGGPIESALATLSHRSVNVASKERLASALAGGFAVVWGLSHRSWTGKLTAALGSGLIYRGVSGHCHLYQALGIDRSHTGEGTRALATGRERAERHYDILRSQTVQRSPDAVYRAWRQSETFAQAMSHFASLTALDDRRTRWAVKDPLGHEHSWVTSLVVDEPGELLRWVTEKDAPLVKSLTLQLTPAAAGRGTEMTLHLRIERPAGALGRLLTKLFGSVPNLVVERALRNVKSLLEAGELPSLTNNPAARASAAT